MRVAGSKSSILPLAFVLFTIISSSTALVSTPYPKVISDLKDAVVKGLGFQADDFKISGFDIRDALLGHSVAYEFDIEIDNKVIPFKLLEDVNRWDYVDLPIFRVEEPARPGYENGLVEQKGISDDRLPVLAPFHLAGPTELWIQDAKDMQVSLPHDVDAGVLKKVILADGAVVTVKGARSVSLRHPVDLPLALNRTNNGFASGLMALAEHLCRSSRSQDAPILSLRIVGPTSLTVPSSTSNKKLKLKRLAPGLVEPSLMSKTKTMDALSNIDLQGEASTVLTPKHTLLRCGLLLPSMICFGMEKKLKEGDGFSLEGSPEWRTKPETVSMNFEVIAKVEGEKVITERIVQVDPVDIEDTIAPNVLEGNTTMSTTPVVHPPPNPFTL
ncbi:putative Basic helix-loop-helix DNA-binding superfamily protein [Hibiscus syriacus]|uniref:Basic helix-loop-helix DNA-binding superfamily protein n=1 Tax=Hibiscus syriacus TaxID=106335 RepID=A0A6A2ZHW5_HIBSY|nr:putative Basic helix-loop-helix DNA-binding superfamily protein [Hibiscus syriacus]